MTARSNSSALARPPLVLVWGKRSLARRAAGRLRQVLHQKLARFRVWNNVRYDARRFLRYSGVVQRAGDIEVGRARITCDYHRLEKGLALPAPRPGFGAAVVKRLSRLVSAYKRRFGHGDVTDIAAGVLRQHALFNGVDAGKDPAAAGVIAAARSVGTGGTIDLTRQDIHAAACLDLSAFFASRHSVRHFDSAAVDPALLRRAVEMAQRTPSVCNRQSVRVHALLGDDRKAAALKYQNGNRGFGHVPMVLVITSDLRSFLEPSERYQAWIDGGLFAMSLNYALHAQGLGVCMLNWCVDAATDSAMRRANDIPPHETIIMLMAVGHLPEHFKVAQSPRRPLEDVLRFDG